MRWPWNRDNIEPCRDEEAVAAIQRAEEADRRASEDLEEMLQLRERRHREVKRNHFAEAIERAFKGDK